MHRLQKGTCKSQQKHFNFKLLTLIVDVAVLKRFILIQKYLTNNKKFRLHSHYTHGGMLLIYMHKNLTITTTKRFETFLKRLRNLCDDHKYWQKVQRAMFLNSCAFIFLGSVFN